RMRRTLSLPENSKSLSEKGSLFSSQAILWWPARYPHQLRNSGSIENHFVLVFSPSGFDEFVMATALPAPDNAVAPTERQLQLEDPSIAVQNVQTLAHDYGILFG